MTFKTSGTIRQISLIVFSSLILSCMPCAENRCVAQIDSSVILKGYKNNLANLKSGECTVSFNPRLRRHYYKGAEDVLIRFSPQGTRMEWRYSKGEALAHFFPGKTYYDIDAATKTLTGYYIRADEKIIQWMDGMLTVSVRSVEPKARPLAYVSVFDFRSFGLCGAHSLFQGKDVEVTLDWFSKLKTDSVKEISPSVFEVNWSKSYPDGISAKWAITFDGNKGYAPVKQVASLRYSEGKAWKITESSETKWINKSGAWVPVEFTCREHEFDDTWEFNLDWQSVNEAIPESIFGYMEFDPTPPDKVNVVDYTLSSSIIIKPRGVPFRPKVGKEDPAR